MAKPSFQSVMDMPMSDIPVPKPVPTGEYLAMTIGQAVDGEASTGTKFKTITFQLLEALDSVNRDELKAALEKPDGTVMPLRDKTLSTRLYITDNAARRNADFLIALGVDPKMSITEAFGNIAGRQAYIAVRHTPSRTGPGVFAEISEVSAVG